MLELSINQMCHFWRPSLLLLVGICWTTSR